MATQDNSNNSTHSTSQTPFGTDAFKFFSNFKNPNLETDNWLASNRKAIQAIEEMQKATAETLKNLTQAQTQYTRQTIEDMTGLIRHLMAAGNNIQEKLDLHSQSLKTHFEKALSHKNNLAEILNQSQDKVIKMTGHHFNEYVDEVHHIAKHATKKS